MSEELKNYLSNNSLILSEQYFYNFIKQNKNEKLLKKYKKNIKNSNDLIIDKTNYHFFYIHFFNQEYNKFLNNINKTISIKLTEEKNILLENKILELKLKSKLIPFNLMYKILFQENYLL